MSTTVLNTRIIEVKNKISDHAKYITTPQFNKLTVESFAARLKQVSLVSKTDFENNFTSFNPNEGRGREGDGYFSPPLSFFF